MFSSMENVAHLHHAFKKKAYCPLSHASCKCLMMHSDEASIENFGVEDEYVWLTFRLNDMNKSSHSHLLPLAWFCLSRLLGFAFN